MLRTPDTDAPNVASDEPAELTVGIQTRVSPRANDMIKERAAKEGLKAATWIRIKLYEALGIMRHRGRK